MATDYTARYIRYGMLSHDEAVRLVKEHDGYPSTVRARFLRVLRLYGDRVLAHHGPGFYNRDIFYK